jgi:protein-histidine N-methyltransferase
MNDTVPVAMPASFLSSIEVRESEDLKMQRFLRWLEENGAYFPALKIETVNGIRGVCAKEQIPADRLVLHIPRCLLLTTAVVSDSKIGKLLKQHAGALGNCAYLVAFLLHTKRHGGFWKPYVDILPTTISNHPFVLPESDLDYLQGSCWLPDIRQGRAQINAEYQRVLVCLPEEDAFTLEEFTWGVVISVTRLFDVNIDGEMTNALVPLADMLNHSPVPNIGWRKESTLGFVMATKDKIDAGMTAYDNYGDQLKGAMFMCYSFCLDSTGEDNNITALLLASLGPEHPYAQHAKDFGVDAGENREFKFGTNYKNVHTKTLFSYLRLMHLDTFEDMHLPTSDDKSTNEIHPVSRQNEMQVLSSLATACEFRIQSFATSIEEDEILLKENSLPRHIHFAVMVRHGEKLVLKHFIDLARMAIPILQDEAGGLDESAASEKRFAHYVAEIDRYLRTEQEEHSQPEEIQSEDVLS